jgi:hypothetical protein
VSSTDATATATAPWLSVSSASRSVVPPKSGLETFVRAFGAGDLIACSTLQPDLEVFATSFGAFAYRKVYGTHVTLGGPLCAPHDRIAMLDRFRSFARAPLLSYVRADVLRDLDAPEGRNGSLAERGLWASGMGKDHLLDVPKLLTSPGPEVQSAVRKAKRASVRLVPFEVAELAKGPARARLERINTAYLESSECNEEMSFLNWPLHAKDRGAHLRRAFWLEKNDRESSGIFGVVALNPIFDQGTVVAYLLDVLRFFPTRIWGLWLSTVHALAGMLHREGLGLSLGYCPLHGIESPTHGRSRALDLQLSLMNRFLRIPFIERLHTMKSLVPHTSEPRFFVGRSRLAPKQLALFTEAQGLRMSRIFGPDLFDSIRRGLFATKSP